MLKKRPELKHHILVLEKAKHPRPKLCGGGLTAWVDQSLARYDLDVDVPTFHVNRVAFYLNQKPIFFDEPGIMRTIRRDEFDAALVERIRTLGIQVLENTGVKAVTVHDDGVTLDTDAGPMRCSVLVGADGAKSTVRRRLFRNDESRVSRLMEVLVPTDSSEFEFAESTATFDFRPVRNGLQGYLWDFPSLINGQCTLNIGIFDSRVLNGNRADLRQLLEKRLLARGIDLSTVRFMGNPERWYHPRRRYGCPRVLLVGDAAGVEPWLGEGIAFSIGYGPVAADTICHALDHDDFSFSDYRRRINWSHLGWVLNRNRLIARCYYRPWFYRLVSRWFSD